mmetsp:Transcript_35528/g.99809  ORF Transcript_35528/g.99809 Transcript_35528/m.99809 type:complete len:542 (+) Transcript_35528:169-1794(+)
MLSTGAAIGSYLGTLASFIVLTLLGVYFNKSLYKDKDSEVWLSARNTQGTLALSLSFFASGAGAWVLFAVPEAAILGGPVALAGYTLSCMVPLAVFGLIGPYFRRELPQSCTFFDYVQGRFGTAVNVYVTLVMLFYMFLYLAAELTSAGSCIGLLSELEDPLGPIIATSLVTLAYTSVGGMPVSLLTDKVQGVVVFIFAILVCAAGSGFYPPPTGPDASADVKANWEVVTTWGINASAGNSFKMAFVLISAVTSANIFHAGYQQRIWAGVDDRSVVRGAMGGALLTAPVMVLFGVLGMVAFANYGIAGLVAPDYLAFLAAFFLIGAMPAVWQVLGIVLAVMMVASSVDTIQTGVAALLKPITQRILDAARPGSEEKDRSLFVMGTNLAITTLFINVPAIALSMADISVLNIFVTADLVCATAVAPVLLGLSPRIHPVAAAAGCAAGLVSAIVIFAVGCTNPEGGLNDNTNAEGNYVPFYILTAPGGLFSETSFIAFLLVPMISGLVTLLANVPYHLKGYRFGGFKQASSEVEDAAVAEATG